MRVAPARRSARRSSAPAGSYVRTRFSANARKSVRASRNEPGQAGRSCSSTRCSRIRPKLDFAPDYGALRAFPVVCGPPRRPQLLRADPRPRDVGGIICAAARRARPPGPAPRGRDLLRRGRQSDDPGRRRGPSRRAGNGGVRPGGRRASLPFDRGTAAGARRLRSRRNGPPPFPAGDQVSLRTTPFHARTGPLSEGQAWRRWAGYVVASAYELSHDREYHAIRNSAALFDVSPLYKYMVTGKDAARLLDHVVTRNVAKAKVGQVLYTPWCDNDGKQIDDGTISVLNEQTFRMTSADPTLRWLHLNSSGLDVAIEDVSERTAAVSLQGPSSRAILQIAAERDLSALKYFRLTSARSAA